LYFSINPGAAMNFPKKKKKKKKMHGTQMSEVKEDENEDGTASAQSRQDGTAST
jgi:hypothetical protein